MSLAIRLPACRFGLSLLSLPTPRSSPPPTSAQMAHPSGVTLEWAKRDSMLGVPSHVIRPSLPEPLVEGCKELGTED